MASITTFPPVSGVDTGNNVDQEDLATALNTKQDTLVSGQSIKTINGQSVLGSGNIAIEMGDTGASSLGELTDLDITGATTSGSGYVLQWDAAGETYRLVEAEEDNLTPVKEAELVERSNHTGTQSIDTIEGLEDQLNDRIKTDKKGSPDGVATLDSDGKVPLSQLPEILDSGDLGSGLSPEQEALINTIPNKVDAIDGMGLSSNNFTNADREKLSNIQAEATKNRPDVELLNRANHDGRQEISTINNLQETLDELQTQNDEFVRSQDVKKIVTMTQLDYEYLSYVDPEVLYIIVPQT